MAEGDGLENHCVSNGTKGSNPLPSAKRRLVRIPGPQHRSRNAAVTTSLGFTSLAIALILAVALALLLAWGNPQDRAAESAPSQVDESAPMSVVAPSEEIVVEPEPEPEPEPLPPIEFTLAFNGDMLIHMPVADSAWATDGGWDFVSLLEPISEYIAGADLAICNMETPLVAPGQTPTGYPMFSAPSELAADMAASGWDGCSTSTNHSVDRGFDGIVDTLDLFDEAGLGHVGTARTEEESQKPQLYELAMEGRTITIAHLSAAFDTNGLPVPEDAPWSWNEIDIERILAEADAALEDGADLVIVSAHCCQVEYTTEVEPYQLEIAEALAEAGTVDLFISHHAHVPKTIDLLPGGPTGEGMWAAWGLGNFISNQSVDCCVPETSTGLVAFFTFEQVEEEHPVVVEASWIGATMDFGAGHRVVPLLADGADSDTLDESEAAYRRALLEDIMDGSPAVPREDPPTATAEVTVIPRSK